MKIISFLLLVMGFAFITWVTLSDNETFVFYGRYVTGALAGFLGVCIAAWLFTKIELE